MAKKKKQPVKTVKVQIEAGKATPAPPLGPALGQAGVNIGTFTQEFNERTRELRGKLPVKIFVYEDRSYEFTVGQPLMSALIKQAAGVQKASGKNKVKKGGQITKAQVKEIAEQKMPDLNANDVEAAMKIVEGQCYSMGIHIVD
jgi:large subunit ribosomal protein L11